MNYSFFKFQLFEGVLLNDLLTKLEKFSGCNFYFGHSETLMPFLARIGVARDDPPLSLDNLPDTRRWRTSLIGGESANLVVVGLKCGDSNKLKFFLNEKEVQVNGCSNSENELCEAQNFIDYNEQFSVDTLDDICQ